ncbi:MAG: oxidoreductase [Actinomycetota bacterium]|nr:oxidoreductase [Actinomycetota bacterium]
MSARWGEQDVPPLDGKVALVTGANAGLGLEAAKVLARHGSEVLLACRNADKAEAAALQVRDHATAAVEVVPLDLASLASVAAAAAFVADGRPRLDLLLNNAGLMAVDESKTEDGFETQIGVNHLGHFALTARLAPLLLSTPGSRVVTMSSMGHRLGRLHLDDLSFETRGYRRWQAYFQSKLANLLFTAELHRRLTEAASATMALAAHPGGSATDLGHEGGGLTNKLFAPFMPLMQPAWLGALPIVRAATDPAARSGQFYGPRYLAGGHPVLERPSRRARRADDARRLWQRSEKLTGVAFAIPG